MRQRELEIALEAVPPVPDPRPEWEQYRTPPRIAADLLYRALAAGDIRQRTVLDLGCGTGMFAIGALLLGASQATGVDVDPRALALAREAAQRVGVAPDFQASDAAEATGTFHTVLMNPPFGAQYAARHLDTVFVTTALERAPVVYSLHLEETTEHLLRLAQRLGAQAVPLTTYGFPLPAQFTFHRKPVREVRVALIRFHRRGSAA